MNKNMAIDAINDAIENRRLAGQPHDKGLDEALKLVETPITEYPDVQKLISRVVEKDLELQKLKELITTLANEAS